MASVRVASAGYLSKEIQMLAGADIQLGDLLTISKHGGLVIPARLRPEGNVIGVAVNDAIIEPGCVMVEEENDVTC